MKKSCEDCKKHNKCMIDLSYSNAYFHLNDKLEVCSKFERNYFIYYLCAITVIVVIIAVII